jgi:SAM-dependent methyltransferase
MKENQWTNASNVSFYQQVPIHYLKELAAKVGLDDCCDVKAIRSHYVANASSILEVGPGFGRVLNYILSLGFQGSLAAIERIPNLIHFLKKEFGDRVEIFETDLLQFKTQKKFDLILWMWAGINEFTKAEQLLALRNLTNVLDPNGFLIFEIIPSNLESVTAKSVNDNNQYRILPTPYGLAYDFCPTPHEIEQYLITLNLKKVEIIQYQSRTNNKRLMYICKL